MSALQKILAGKTDSQLLYYIAYPEKHTQEAVNLAIEELKKRNVTIPEDLLTKSVVKADTSSSIALHVAPAYYSQTAIYAFSILCTPLFGSFLISANNEAAGRSRWPVVFFGLFITIATGLFFSVIHFHSTTCSFIANSLGVTLMYELYWNKHKIANGNYRHKSIRTPLIVALCIFSTYITLIVRFLI